MSRPRTKGEMIGVRLPLEVDAKIRQEAQRNEMSPGRYIAELLTSKQQPSSACQHRNTKVIQGGLKRCEECSATRNAKGEWS